MQALNARTLKGHLIVNYGDSVSEQGLNKAEIYLMPQPDSVYGLRYRPLRLPDETGAERRNRLLDDTKTVSDLAVGYTISDSSYSDAAILAHVYDAAKLDRRGYKLTSHIEGKAAMTHEEEKRATDAVIGMVQLPIRAGVSKADEQLNEADKITNANASKTFPVRSQDMFLVNDALIPAQEWLRIPEQDRAEHIAQQHSIV